MKKRHLILFIASLAAHYSVQAQTICPMLQDGKVWTYEATNLIYDWEETYSLEGDTVIGSRNCLKLYFTCLFHRQDHLYKGAMYEKGGQVYIIAPGSTTPALLYDFSSKPGTTIKVGEHEIKIEEKKLVKYRGEYLRVVDYSITEDEYDAFNVFEGIEGVGYLAGGLTSILDGWGPGYDGGANYLKKCTMNGEVIFDSDDFNASSETVTPQPFLEGNPIWVYKHEHMTMPEDQRLKCWVDTGDQDYCYYFLGEQKEIEGKSYTMMGEVGCNRNGEISLNQWYPVREENGVVYTITDSLPGVVEHYYNDFNELSYFQQGNECVLYNFSAEIGEMLYQYEGSALESFDSYRLMDGTECRVLKTSWGSYDLYEKLGLLSDDIEGIMDPFLPRSIPTDGSVHSSRLNAYYQDNVMLYKASDAPEGLCMNDTCWTRDEAEAYAVAYKANPYHDEVMSFIRQLQGIADPVAFTEGQMATIVLPTAPEASRGKYYRLDRVEGNEIIFEEEKQPKAHIPYIIVPSEDFSIDLGTLDLNGLSRDTVSIDGVSFIGTYQKEEIENKEGFYIDLIDTTPDCILSDNKLKVGALRAFLQVHWDDPYSHGGTKAPAEKMQIVLHDRGTGLKPLSNSPLKGEIIYGLNGRIVNGKLSNSKLPHGIYIEDGRKKLK